jgi:hypothetical protein
MKTLIIVSTLIIAVSCGENRNEKPKAEIQNPEALQDVSSSDFSSSISKTRGGNLIDELYNELVEKDSDLMKLETELDEFSQKPNETQNIFHSYDSKSKQYYGDANSYANQISDSIAKRKILNFIKQSSEKYEIKSKTIKELTNEISKNQTTLNDNHQILKIALTLPIIEKYQTDNLPKADTFNQTIGKQKELNKKILDKTPKF